MERANEIDKYHLYERISNSTFAQPPTELNFTEL